MNAFVKENLKYFLKNKKILLGITGSIAAFKAHDIIRLLRDCGAEVRVVLTKSALQFVSATTLTNLTGTPALFDLWDESQTGTHHIQSARWADLFLIAPATANLIGKLAGGVADDLLTTELLAFHGPVFIAPAMNPQMWHHTAVQENIDKLISRKNKIIGPCTGITSCGEEGLGRMVEPAEIVQSVASYFTQPSNSRSLTITLGPTRSFCDPVRYITNRSSGVMGAALCWAALKRGYQVLAIHGPIDTSMLPLPFCFQFETRAITTTSEMSLEVSKHFQNSDVFISAAAVLDWEFKNKHQSKIKKNTQEPQFEFQKTIDILASLEKNKDQFVLGFAAETEDFVQNAKQKLQSKQCSAIFVNDVASSNTGFESLNNAGYWVSSNRTLHLPVASKTEIAHQLIDLIQSEYSTAPTLREAHA